MRKVLFANDEIYHVINRGVEQRPTFTNSREYNRAIAALDFYRFQDPSLRLAKALVLEKEERESFFLKLKQKEKKLVEIISFCLMPNHFHFLLKQKKDGGIPRFISNFTNSYTKYFNTKNKRVGPLFQGVFKSARIETNEQLLHVSRYIHLNPVVSFLVKEEKLDAYLWSSLPEYLGISNNGICDKEIIFSQFSSIEKYRKFVFDHIEYARKLEAIKHLMLEQIRG